MWMASENAAVDSDDRPSTMALVTQILCIWLACQSYLGEYTDRLRLPLLNIYAVCNINDGWNSK